MKLQGPRWQTDRACILHREFSAAAQLIAAEGLPLVALLGDLAARLAGTPLDGGKRQLKASAGTLVRLWYAWDAAGRKCAALLPEYRTPAHVRHMPAELCAEIQRLASGPRGGRDKDGNGIEGATIRRNLAKAWRAGESLPGVGTWREFWARTQPGSPPPAVTPEFPWSAKTVVRKMGTKAVRIMGNIGRAKANKHLPHMERDYSKLRKCEYYTLDDARADLVAIDELTGRVVDVLLYLFMEVSSRQIIGFLCKPKNNIKAEDVDELVAHSLQTDGFGVGIGYASHIWFERGTVACSEAAQAVLEAGSEGAIKVHRTGMDGGTRWIGAARDKSSGHANGKAVIESFVRNLHRRLIHLPGQRGNTYANQPANLGVGEASVKDPSKRNVDGTVKAEAERLAQFKLTAMAAGTACDLKLPLLTISSLQREIAATLKSHNTDRGHGMQGFHSITEAEVGPGVWRQVSL